MWGSLPQKLHPKNKCWFVFFITFTALPCLDPCYINNFLTTHPHQLSSFICPFLTRSNSKKYSILESINESSIFRFPSCYIFSIMLVSPISSLRCHSLRASLSNSFSLSFAFWSKSLIAFYNFSNIHISILCGAFIGGSSVTCQCLVTLINSIKGYCNSGIVFLFPFLDRVVLSSSPLDLNPFPPSNSDI